MLKIVYRLVSSKESILMVLLPSLLYFALYHEYGLTYAIGASSIYGITLMLISRQLGLISLAFALSGLVELVIITVLPKSEATQAVQYKVLLSSLSTACVFLVFAVLRKPIPMLVAEASMPSLQHQRLTVGSPSLKKWQYVNGIWLCGYLLKSLMFVNYSHFSQQQLVMYTLISGWPLYVVLILMSVGLMKARHPIIKG
ncbi:hypothetical protein VPAL9027_01325 [Vibrio palustris]|uniref:Intracellular septation protein A n=1 Tax=Vibrio palustris TaxID=1918946 RepID=A0A1R4B369_9VIBR|nr:hypothetical protein VPAL9027_01325 [Vibrio palustris]